MFRTRSSTLRGFAASTGDQDSAHRLGGGAEEVRAVLPGLRGGIHQLEPRLMDERGRLEGVARAFPGHFMRGQAAQFVVNQRQQFVRGLGVALLDGGENAGNVAHASASHFGGGTGAGSQPNCWN